MIIEISDEDLTCLLFWHTVFKGIITETDRDKDLFGRLASIWFSTNPKDFCCWTGVPGYQPGEGKNVKTGVCLKDEGGAP